MPPPGSPLRIVLSGAAVGGGMLRAPLGPRTPDRPNPWLPPRGIRGL